MVGDFRLGQCCFNLFVNAERIRGTLICLAELKNNLADLWVHVVQHWARALLLFLLTIFLIYICLNGLNLLSFGWQSHCWMSKNFGKMSESSSSRSLGGWVSTLPESSASPRTLSANSAKDIPNWASSVFSCESWNLKTSLIIKYYCRDSYSALTILTSKLVVVTTGSITF